MDDDTAGARVVVSNTTPVSNLIRIHHLPLLGRLYGRVLIPEQVALEMDAGEHVLGAWRRADGADAPAVEAPLDGPFPRQLLLKVDPGEAAAIALAVERRASILLIDELDGRKVAIHHGLHVVGTLGILLDAKSEGCIGEVRPLIDALERESFHVGAALRHQVLVAAGETP